MRKFAWYVFTKCDPDHAEAFNRWYDDIHLADLLKVPGIVDAKRLHFADKQIVQRDGEITVCAPDALGSQYPYLAVYEIEAEDVEPVLREVTRRSMNGEMEISPYLGDVHMLVYERK